MEELKQIFEDSYVASKSMIVGILMILILPIRMLNLLGLEIINFVLDEK